jgi:hypothetical protein
MLEPFDTDNSPMLRAAEEHVIADGKAAAMAWVRSALADACIATHVAGRAAGLSDAELDGLFRARD